MIYDYIEMIGIFMGLTINHEGLMRYLRPIYSTAHKDRKVGCLEHMCKRSSKYHPGNTKNIDIFWGVTIFSGVPLFFRELSRRMEPPQRSTFGAAQAAQLSRVSVTQPGCCLCINSAPKMGHEPMIYWIFFLGKTMDYGIWLEYRV